MFNNFLSNFECYVILMIVYNFDPSIKQPFFNYNQFVQELNIEEFLMMKLTQFNFVTINITILLYIIIKVIIKQGTLMLLTIVSSANSYPKPRCTESPNKSTKRKSAKKFKLVLTKFTHLKDCFIL